MVGEPNIYKDNVIVPRERDWVDDESLSREETLARFRALGPQPSVGPIPHRTVRVPDDLWRGAQAKAAERGDNLSEVIRQALTRYVRRR